MIPVWPVLLLLVSSVSSPRTADATRSRSSSLESKAGVCSGHRVSIPFSNGTWLPLNHRHGPCSPLAAASSSSSERIPPSTADVVRWDRLRSEAIRRGDVTVPTRLGTDEYVVTVGLGTPAVEQTVLIDTGSDITWVQCRPCPVPPCHPQKDAVFDPDRSATYSAFSCGSAACLGLGLLYSNGCFRSRCQYAVFYADLSNTTGTYSSDKLTLQQASGGGYTVASFQFGCSHADPLFDDDLTDGVMGLGPGAQSLVMQTAEKTFSYCLPPTASHSGFLTLGVPRVVSSSSFVVTPMHEIGDISKHYGVRLQGIKVAGRRLHIPPSVFSAGSSIDSGSAITQLPATAYAALRSAFRKEMRMYPRAPPPTNDLDTCYNLSSSNVKYKLPSVALLFQGGATLELHPSGILYHGCLAFYSTGDDTSEGTIGNVQQRTFEVLFDVGGQAVGFRRGAC